MSAENIAEMIGAGLLAITWISTRLPNSSNNKAVQTFLSVVNVLSANIGKNKNAE